VHDVFSENHMHTLALMAEKKTGKTFLQLFEELIKQPLGLTVSTFPGNNPRPSCMLASKS
jgi:CubicO group peptidase (beta-lactamase class C family)